MMSNVVEFCRIIPNVEFYRILNFVELGRIFRIMSNDVEFLSNVVEFSRILSNSPRILSNASNPLNFIDFCLFFSEFGKYCILVQYNPIPGISSSFQFISVQFNYFPVTSIHFSIFMVGQLNSKEGITSSFSFFTSDHSRQVL